MIADGDFGLPAAPGRLSGQWLSDRLVWVLTWSNVRGGRSVDEELRTPYPWTGIKIVDAVSGQLLWATEIPEASLPY